MNTTNQIVDLFSSPEKMPDFLKDIFAPYESESELSYEILGSLQKQCEKVGYTFDFYLDAVPYGLRKIGTPLNQLIEYKDI
jgi:hypothetical protein